MIRRTIKYTDFDGNEREETLYFNLSKTEVYEMENSVPGGFTNGLKGLIDRKEYERSFSIIKAFILKCYGVKSDDGRHFWKKDPVTGKNYADEFAQSEAFEAFYDSLLSDEKGLEDFVNGVIPKASTPKTDSAKVITMNPTVV